jgi:hypothetical protein
MRFQNAKLDWSPRPPWWGLIRKRLMAVFASYRPELHYMRGPGPKWREKHAQPTADQLGWPALPEGQVHCIGLRELRERPRRTRVRHRNVRRGCLLNSALIRSAAVAS